MSKTNKEEIIKLCNEINKKEGKGSVYTIGSESANLKINRWSTGIEDLDAIIGGGMPEGRVVEIFGPESSGKTTLLYHLCGLHSLCLDIPIEGTFDAERAKVFGNRPKQMLIYRAKYGEDAFEVLWKQYVSSMEIAQRHNEKCQNTMMPKWYRKYMFETE